MGMSTFRSLDKPPFRAAAPGIAEVRPFVNALNAPAKSFAAPDHDRCSGFGMRSFASLRMTASRSLGCCLLFLLRVALGESVDAACRVDQLLLAGEERVAL